MGFYSFFPMSTIDHLSQTPSSQNQGKSPSYDFEMGSLLLSSGNFRKSLPYLTKALHIFLEKKDFPSYISCYTALIEALNELGEKEVLKKLKQNVEETCKAHNIQNTAGILSCSAYYNIYIEKNLDKAKKELNEALKIAFDTHDKYIETDDRLKQNTARFDIMKCLYVYSIYYFEIEDYENCIQELKNLKILIKDYSELKKEVELDHCRTDNAQELQICHNILEELKKNFQAVQKMQMGLKFAEALIEIRYIKNYKQAEKLLWELYEEANKTHYLLFIPYILCSMALCCIKLGNKKQAQMFFNLAEKNANKERKSLMLYMKSLKEQENLDQTEKTEIYDIVFDLTDHIIVERQKGCIELKNQFILIDLLKLFLLNPGVSYSKEKIIQKIWKQDYFPEIHDNKIYVTIKRLREMIEINSYKPRYICRDNAGYYFSKQAKVLVKQ